MIAIYHKKSEIRGWREVFRAPIESDAWTNADRWAINHLLENGEQVLTMGWDMWEIKNGGEIARPTKFEKILTREIEERKKST